MSTTLGMEPLTDPATVRLEHATLDGETLVFEHPGGLERALRMGFLLVRAPDDLALEPALTLARHFNEPRGRFRDGRDAYRGFREAGPFCFDRSEYQVEQLIIGREERERLLPPDALAVTTRMSEMAVSILRGLLRWYGIDEALWDQVSGGCASGRGTHWFVANRYDPEASGLGCAPHTDTGFVTVLYADRPGLEVGIDGHWTPLECRPRSFVVNFGVALETLSRHMSTPACAALHRVATTTPTLDGPPRVSIAAFASAPTHGVLYEIAPDGSAAAVHDVDTLLQAHDAGTWKTGRGPDQARSAESARETTRTALETSRLGA
ncbi:2OG-Fe(II) oxygenase family protein [Salinarimonas chemoclinalis]|uniref:2OG-Fe(II) oxygenase family protein n=1 Tax=Salinarimonas chemoclinalis TaxID=3241599 RepID=UPI0035572580